VNHEGKQIEEVLEEGDRRMREPEEDNNPKGVIISPPGGQEFT
jgi:hypothetical protein